MTGKHVEAFEARPEYGTTSVRRPELDRSKPGHVGVNHRPNKPSDPSLSDLASRLIALLPRLNRFATLLTHDRSIGEDLVQETYVRALEHLDQWRPDSRLDSWMYRIAQNLWIDRLRMERVRGETIDIAAAGEVAGCDGRVVAETRLEVLELCKRIVELPLDQQVLVTLIFIDGLSYREAAEAVDAPEGTVMSRLARARLALSGAIRESGEPPEN